MVNVRVEICSTQWELSAHRQVPPDVYINKHCNWLKSCLVEANHVMESQRPCFCWYFSRVYSETGLFVFRRVRAGRALCIVTWSRALDQCGPKFESSSSKTDLFLRRRSKLRTGSRRWAMHVFHQFLPSFLYLVSPVSDYHYGDWFSLDVYPT